MRRPHLHFASPSGPDSAIVDAIARRVVELLKQEQIAGARATALITAADVAKRYGVGVNWVYEHAERLGPIRLGKGRRARLRFDPERVEEALRSPTTQGATALPARPRRRGHKGLLPIGGG